VNDSCRHSVHTVVWLSCRKIGVALLVESTGIVSLSPRFLSNRYPDKMDFTVSI